MQPRSELSNLMDPELKPRCYVKDAGWKELYKQQKVGKNLRCTGEVRIQVQQISYDRECM